MTTLSAPITADEAVAVLREHPDYRVLRRFQPRERYWQYAPPADALRAVFLDVEATGLDTDLDEITELALLPFTFDRDGKIYDVGPGHVWLNEPTRPIPEIVQQKTGITPDTVRGHVLATEAIAAALGDVALIIAHSARYDRKMVERYVPITRKMPWACSQDEVKWDAYGVAGGALANILITATGEFPDVAHRALHDCAMGVHVLAGSIKGGIPCPAFPELLASARGTTYRVCAHNSPMEAKDMLRARGYRALYQGGRFCYWYKDLRDGVEDECDWCEREAYAEPEVAEIGARDRYSARVG